MSVYFDETKLTYSNKTLFLEARKRLIGFNIATVRKEQKFSQEDLAAISGVSLSTISKIESMKYRRIPRLIIVFKIAKALEVPMDRIFKDIY